jgi:8-oxo-dGTP pyrophosphatase MutT (NUDIX family)
VTRSDQASTDLARARAEAALVAIEPWDDVERAHRADALKWLRSGAPIFRQAQPATPPKHLVVYFLLVDPIARRCLLVDHRKAHLWLPTGGHVEPGEDPAATVEREAREELGIAPPLLDGLPCNPFFVTVTETVGADAGHVDVSLWYVCRADVAEPLGPDPAEFRAVRWWGLDALAAADPAGLDPHLPRFAAKLSAIWST